MSFASTTEALAPPAAAPASRAYARAALALLALALGYNLVLALVNNQVAGIGRSAPIAVEVLLTGAALGLIALQWRPSMTRWALMILVFAILQALLTLLRQAFDPKALRDTLMLATFIMLGMTVPRAALARALPWVQLAIVLVMLFEVSFPELWGEVVSPRSYLVATRGFEDERFFGSDLLGAVRPDDRYILPQLGWIRASSIFLEPLSLGNWAVFAALALLLFWRDWRPGTRVLMVATTLLVMIGSDGRFGAITAVALLVLAPVLRRLPPMLAALYLPLAVVLARWGSVAGGWNHLEDNFGGRLARGMRHLFRLDTHALLGAEIPAPILADAGIAHLVVAQSLLGVALLQGFLYLQPGLRDPDQRLALHAIALMFALSILVSISMLSIKTAAPLWFTLGVLIAAAPAGRERRTD